MLINISKNIYNCFKSLSLLFYSISEAKRNQLKPQTKFMCNCATLVNEAHEIMFVR